MKKLKIIASILITFLIISVCLVFVTDIKIMLDNISIYIEYDYKKYYGYLIFNDVTHCLLDIALLLCSIFVFIVLWKSDLAILMESIAEKDKAKRKAAKQAKLQREIAEKMAQLEELNNQPSGEENGE